MSQGSEVSWLLGGVGGRWDSGGPLPQVAGLACDGPHTQMRLVKQESPSGWNLAPVVLTSQGRGGSSSLDSGPPSSRPSAQRPGPLAGTLGRVPGWVGRSQVPGGLY